MQRKHKGSAHVWLNQSWVPSPFSCPYLLPFILTYTPFIWRSRELLQREKNNLQLLIMVIIIKQSLNRKSNYLGGLEGGGSHGTALILFHWFGQDTFSLLSFFFDLGGDVKRALLTASLGWWGFCLGSGAWERKGFGAISILILICFGCEREVWREKTTAAFLATFISHPAVRGVSKKVPFNSQL